MGTVSSHSAFTFLCVDYVGPRRVSCACDSTSGFSIFDVHRDTMLKWLQGCDPMSLVEVELLLFFALCLSLAQFFDVWPTWVKIGVEGWDGVSQLPSHK